VVVVAFSCSHSHAHGHARTCIYVAQRAAAAARARAWCWECMAAPYHAGATSDGRQTTVLKPLLSLSLSFIWTWRQAKPSLGKAQHRCSLNAERGMTLRSWFGSRRHLRAYAHTLPRTRAASLYTRVVTSLCRRLFWPPLLSMWYAGVNDVFSYAHAHFVLDCRNAATAESRFLLPTPQHARTNMPSRAYCAVHS